MDFFSQLVTLFHVTVFSAGVVLPTPFPTPSHPIINPTATAYPTPTETPIPSTPTPTKSHPTPTPTSIPITATQLDRWFTEYSNNYSIDRKKLWQIAVCESNLRPYAKNGDYSGMYQFSSSTWISTRKTMNEDPDPQLRFSAEQAIKTAAFKISIDGLSSWPNCSI